MGQNNPLSLSNDDGPRSKVNKLSEASDIGRRFEEVPGNPDDVMEMPGNLNDVMEVSDVLIRDRE